LQDLLVHILVSVVSMNREQVVFMVLINWCNFSGRWQLRKDCSKSSLNIHFHCTLKCTKPMNVRTNFQIIIDGVWVIKM